MKKQKIGKKNKSRANRNTSEIEPELFFCFEKFLIRFIEKCLGLECKKHKEICPF